MERVVFVVVIAVVAVGIAALVQRRQRPATPTQTGYNVPDHVDRADFARPEAEWLVVVFTSATCGTCAEVWDKVQVLASDTVAVQELEVNAERELHKKYAIDGVPATVLVDSAGAVRGSFLGPVTSTDLWATLAELRDPGCLPDNACDHGVN